LSTDGFFDQHGENDSNPFGMDNFAQLLLENEALPLEEQKNVLMDSLHAYMGSEKQRDDITIIGFEL
jgi:serine phosphatase RsbU (regulator of sigma subunit)